MAIRDLIPWSRGDNLPAYRDDPFMAFRREMDRLFDDAFRGLEGGRLYSRLYGTTWPRVEVTDSEREICITAEMPGMDEKDIEITFDDGAMVLKGEKREDMESKDRRFSERYYGRFERRIPIGTEVQDDQIRARFKNGVLHVTMPKTERAQSKARRIPVEAEADAGSGG